MAYAEYNQVYFASSLNNKTFIKIGKTSNVNRRRGQLFKQEDFWIEKWHDVPSSRDSSRTFVESFLRERINATGRVQQIREDYFLCDNESVADWIRNQFSEWVNDACRIIELMDCGGTVFFNFGPAKRPIPPKGRERLFAEVNRQIDSRGYYSDHAQIKYKESETIFKELKEAYSPFGYKVEMEINCSWTYFTVKKQRKGVDKTPFFCYNVIKIKERT